MNSISPNLNVMIKASEKASKILIRDFGEIEKLQVSKKGASFRTYRYRVAILSSRRYASPHTTSKH